MRGYFELWLLIKHSNTLETIQNTLSFAYHNGGNHLLPVE